ncbi:MAG: WG repeat-containing protein [Lachnospiraceae bacterium]|nr:WG repeat-containing protein [Lachnospiraceae bacterium]
MKFTRLLTIIAMIVLCAAGWLKVSVSTAQTIGSIRQYISAGDTYYEKQLYELAIRNYNSALSIKKSQDTYDRILNAYREWYAEEPRATVKRSFINTYEEGLRLYPKRTDYWEGYAQVYYDSASYTDVADIYARAAEQNIRSEKLTAMYKDIYYRTKLMYGSYPIINMGTYSGLYTYSDGGAVYGTLTADGGDDLSPDLSYINTAGDGGTLLTKNADGECFVLNAAGTTLGRFKKDVKEAGAIYNGLIPVLIEGRNDWCYIDYNGEELFGGYQYAGSFRGGNAAVQTADGQWTVINTDGSLATSETYDEILVDEGGSFLMNGYMMYRSGDSWRLKDLTKAEAEEFVCDGLDISRGEAIAFRRGEFWGFVGTDGNILIEPAYENARSFSGGVAAVCKDGLWGFIDRNGEYVIEPEYLDAGYFDTSAGTCPVIVQETNVYRILKWAVER